MGKAAVKRDGCPDRRPVLLGRVSLSNGSVERLTVPLSRPLGEFREIIVETSNMRCVREEGRNAGIFDASGGWIGDVYLYHRDSTDGADYISTLLLNKVTGRGVAISHASSSQIHSARVDLSSMEISLYASTGNIHTGTVEVYGIE